MAITTINNGLNPEKGITYSAITETWNGTAIIFNESTSKFQGWDGSAWNDFH